MTQPDLPMGLPRVVLQVLQHHRGAASAVSKAELTANVSRIIGASERQIRLAIEELRRQGVLVCAMSSAGGYFIADNRQEVDAFLAEYLARVREISQTAHAMSDAAVREFGEGGYQTGLPW